MVASASSPDSVAAILTSATKPHSSATRSYRALAFLNFFFHRVTRSGPRLLLYLAILLASLLALTKCLPSSVSNRIVSSTSHLWEFRPSGLGGSRGASKGQSVLVPGENNAHDALAGGGLRVVVFGENDIATSVLSDVADAQGVINDTSWTKELCIDLGCTTYISCVPVLDSPHRSLSSNSLYGAAVDEALRDSKQHVPADDFTYVSEQYPIPWEAPDLYTQVAQFLEQPAPQRPPKETVWVFAPGMWDVWSLAAFPAHTAEAYVTSMVYDLFSTIEMLYDAAHDATSIAYSKYIAVPLDDDIILASGNNTANINNPDGAAGQNSDLKWEDTTSEPFRVVIPLLFDPSLMPAWHLDRPNAPDLHTKPEHLRNAVRLTKLWNDFVLDGMHKWSKKNATFIHPDDRVGADAESTEPAESAATGASPSSLTGTITGTTNDLPSHSAKRRQDIDRPPVPTLLRDGILFRMSDYLMDVIIDGQMRARGIVDKKGFGKLPKSDRYLEVDKPCVAPQVIGLPTGTSKITTELRFEEDKKQEEDKQGDGATDSPTLTFVAPGPLTGTNTQVENPTHTYVAPGPPTGTAQPKKARNNGPSLNFVKSRFRSKIVHKDVVSAPAVPALTKKLAVCEEPDDHLFFTSFSLGRRAIEEIGRLAAAVVRASPATRSAWEMNRRSSFEKDRKPASWKEYYHS
ncbi:hypothetical protein HMPREF1624_05750 [Sporothrix schenckii ATCC 58251]|uniref:Uncharacterized protein n=1 Tax=Sporothrix schenckii (strain ATCC 58251 / de Perez 2211183) TaxID=1391915 RepID=U7PS57_SPOS1|nr:hypothetical protein HMPREF1624_05750 [Sporothrix schenckii ATCC 58251]